MPLETLVCIPGAPRAAKGVVSEKGEYETARYRRADDGSQTHDERATPLLALVELYRPAYLILLCTPEAEKTTLPIYREWIDAEPIEPRPTLHVVPLEMPTDDTFVPAVLDAIARIEPPTADIHLDLTFGPRSVTIPALLAALVQRAAGRWNIRRLTYVNFEAGTQGANGTVPIEDLTACLALPDLVTAVRNLRERGDIVGFVTAASRMLGPDALQPATIAHLNRVHDALGFLSIPSLIEGKAAKALDQVIGALRQLARSNPLLAPLVADAEQELAGLRPPTDQPNGSPLHLARLVEWFRDHNQPDRALLLATEALTLLVCERLLGKPYPQKNGKEYWRVADYYEKARDLAHNRGDEALKTFVGKAQTALEYLGNCRHQLAHASLGSPTKPSVTADKVREALDRFLHLCRAWPTIV